MANHVRHQLRDAIAALLTGLTTTGARVFPSRTYALQAAELPALLVYTTSEEAELITVNTPLTYERQVAIRIEGFAVASADLDDTLDRIAKEVEIALAAGVTISSRTIALYYEGCDIAFESEGDKPKGSINLRYTATLFTVAATPDVFA